MKFLFIAFFSFAISFAQSSKEIVKKIGNDPVIFIDSVNVEKSELEKYDPNDISTVTVYKDKKALDLLGEDGKNGVIYIETKAFCRNKYWNYFKSKSSEYSQLVTLPTNDNNVQYILNDKVLTINFEDNLSSIDDKIFKSISYINKEDLIAKYNITDKDFGFLIISETP